MLDAHEYEAAAATTRDMLELLQQDGDQVFELVLQRIVAALRSPLGFCGHINEAGDLVICASTTPSMLDPRPTPGHPIRFPHSEWSGLSGQILQERRTLFRNGRHQLPPGCRPVHRSLGAPIVCKDELLGSVYVANRDDDYGERDAELLNLLVSPLAPVLQARQQQDRERRDAAQSISDLERAVDVERQAKQASLQSLADLQRIHQQILDESPAVVYMKDLDGRYQFVNRRYEDLFHVRREEFCGKTDFDLFPAELAAQFRRNDVKVAETGEPLRIREVAQHDEGPHTYFSIKFPLRNPQGEICSVAGISTDITDKVQAEREVTRLSRQRALILDAVGDGVLGIDGEGRTTLVNPLATALLGWSEEDLLGQPLKDFLKHEILPITAAPAALDEVLVEDEDAVFRTKDGDWIEVRYIVRPLVIDGRSSGAVITFRSRADETEREARMRLQREASQRTFEQDRQLRAIRSIQTELFHEANPAIPGYDIAARNFPQHIVSGDFYDFIPQPDGSLIVIVGDATGHDLTSAVHMVEAHAVLHTLLDCGIPLERMLERLNQVLCRHLSGRFVSLFVLRLEPHTGRLEFAGAGHDASILRVSGRIESLPSSGLVLGLETSGQSAKFAQVQLEPGDTVLLLTDGFQEAASPDRKLFGRKRIFDVAKQARQESVGALIEQLKLEVDRHTAPSSQQDDMTAVVIRRSGQSKM